MLTDRSRNSESQGGDDPADRIRRAGRRAWNKPPRISVPEWADRYRRLAKEAGSHAGNWRTSTVEAARGPMLAVTEPGVHIVTVMCCTQLLKSELMSNVFGYFAHLDPSPMLMIRPNDSDADAFSKERLTPFVKATPELKALIGTEKTRNSKETLGFKTFPGGYLAIVGAGSPANLASRPVRIVLADEVDKYPVTREGDPTTLAEERTATFGANWLSIRACSPTVEDESRIEASYKSSDMRRASVACPHCGERIFPDFFRHVHWDKTEDGRHLPATARIFCDRCGAGWSEGERLLALRTIRWHQTRPFHCCGSERHPLRLYEAAQEARHSDPVGEAWEWSESPRHAVYMAKCPECGRPGVDNRHAGFQASKMLSPWQKDRPADIAAKWLAAQGDEDLLTAWWNTQMGMAYRPRHGKRVDPAGLAARRELWPAEVPDGVGLITVGADFQADRAEIEVVGWGRDEESWSIAYEVIEGDPETPDFWRRVDAFLLRRWVRADGRVFEVAAACLDSGHHTQKVYEFCKARLGRRVWAIKGESATSGQRSPVWPTKRPSSRNKQQFRPVIIGVNAAKDTIRNRLANDKPGPGCMHFPADRDIGWFEQLTSERIEVKESAGHRYRVWTLPSGRANEALDCRVYAYAALCGLAHLGLKLNSRVEAVAARIGPDIYLDKAVPKDGGAAAAKPPRKSLSSRLA